MRGKGLLLKGLRRREGAVKMYVFGGREILKKQFVHSDRMEWKGRRGGGRV